MQLHSFCLFVFCALYTGLYFFSIEIYSNLNDILANTKIIRGGVILKQSSCRGAIEQKRLKTTGLGYL